jgi:flagellar basal body-associated protein FliL
MVRIIIIIVLVFAIAVGGVFGVATFSPSLLPSPILTLLGIELPPQEKTRKNSIRPTAAETVLIDIKPLQIPLFRDGSVDRSLFMHILIEVRQGPDADLVNKELIRIVDSFLSYVHALNELNIKPGVSDRAFLKQRLLVKAEEIVGQGVIVDLLFVNVFERPFN